MNDTLKVAGRIGAELGAAKAENDRLRGLLAIVGVRAILAQPAEAEGVRDYLTEFTEGEVEAKTAIEELQDALSAVTAERDGLAAARMAYANEFAPDENGDPDVGNVHANIRALKAERDRLRAVLEGAQYPNIDRLKTLTIEQCRQVGETVMRLTIDAQSERDQLRAEVDRLRNELAGKPLVC